MTDSDLKPDSKTENPVIQAMEIAPAVLALEDGTVFYGKAIGAIGGQLSRADYFAIRNTVGPGSPKVADASGSRK